MPSQQADKEQCRGRERLVRAAQKLAQDTPFNDITIEEIIKEAALSRPSFYYHFTGGKEELREELIRRGLLEDTPAQDIRQAIIDAAIRQFARSGIAATTLDDIAAEAGVTRGALNWHFHSKDDLLAAIIKQCSPHLFLRPLLDEIEEDVQHGVIMDDETLFRRLIGAFYDAFTSMSDLARLAVLVFYTHPQAARVISEVIGKGRVRVVGYVRQKQEEGRFRQDIDPTFFVHILASTLAMKVVGRELSESLPPGHLAREDFIDQMVTLLLYGMMKRDEPDKKERKQSSFQPC
jgi:TetR/AcrR family transcriptional regulator